MPSPLNKTITLSPEDLQQPVSTIPDGPVADGLYVGDVTECIAKLPKESFDLIVADPPYNLGRFFGNNRDSMPEPEYRDWAASWVLKASTLLSKNGSMYVCSDWKHSGLYQRALEDAGLHVVNRITWKRDKGRGAKRNWKQNMEDIWFAVKDVDEYTFNLDQVKLRKKVIAPYREKGMPKDWLTDETGENFRMTHPSNIWIDLTVPFWSMPENTEHPTQKPESLAERIILASTNPGDRVLDLFSGSGTASVVAARLGRGYVGIEMNPDYVRLGMKRIARLTEETPAEAGSEKERSE